jgi:membrane protease YdiL (CAAX protease family)
VTGENVDSPKGDGMRKLSASSALFISLGVIVLMWTRKVIRNTLFIDDILRLFESVESVLLDSFIMGLFTLVIVTLLLRLSGERYKHIGFDTRNLRRQLGFGILFGVLIFLFDTFVSSPLIEGLLPSTSAQGVDMGRLFTDISLLPLWILVALFKGAFSEELWRVFALTRFEKFFGKPGLILALILSSVVFGFGHLYQGLSGLITIGIIGFLYALVYLRRRSALEAVVAHATFNMIGVVLGYIMYCGK